MKYIVLLFILCSALIPTQAQVTAEFTADKTSGCAPLTVRFQNQSTPDLPATTYRWDLGNGVTSTAKDPLGTYFNPGTYTVKLVVRNGADADSVLKTQYITVFTKPEVAFSASDTVGCFPLTVNFTDQSTTSSGTITSRTWDFGDGTIYTGPDPNPSHIYAFSGEFTVTLSITTSDNCSNSIAKQKHINISPGVHTDFFAPIASACKPPVSISFTNLSTGPGTLAYAWDFGNGKTSTARNPVNIFDAAGDFTVTLVTSSNSGCSDTMRKQVNIPASTVQSAFTGPDTICIRQPVTFINTSLPDPDSSFWSFGDGTTQIRIDPLPKTYNTPGTYNVKLRNKFGTCVDSIIKPIVVVDTPRAAFTNSKPLGCKPPFTVRFTNQSTGAVTYLWEFGDGTTSTQTNPEKIYNSFGTFNVRLTATNRNGCRSVVTKTQLVTIAKPVFQVRNLPDSGCIPFTLSPLIDVIAVDTVASYLWDFGNGQTSTLAKPTVTYNAVGNYTIKLVITTRGGCRDSISVHGIKAGEGGNVTNFSASPLIVCAGQPVQFTDQSTGPVTGWLWDFGDGTFSNKDNNPIHIYSDTGFFDITLNSFNNGCGAELIKEDYIRVIGAVARWGYQIDCDNRRRMQFLDSSINAATWFWDFGDGTTSTEKSPLHTFPNEGEYNVSLTVTRDGCTFTLPRKIFIVNEKAVYTISPGIICRGTTATFTARESVPDFAVGRYEWDYGNGVYVDGPRISTFSSAGMANGTYTTRLRITDFNGCFDSTSRPITISGPTAGFISSNISGCKNLTASFTDTSFSDGTAAIVNRIWDFGDGIILNTTNTSVQHLYTRAGTFTVKLKVIDAAGCTDSLVMRNLVTTSEPVAAFIAQDTITCPGRPIQFVNNSTATVNNFSWTFGDGGVSTGKNPAYVYNSVGTYTVKLKIRDRFGCEDSATKVNYIVVDTPYAAFTISDSVGTCPPLRVKFNFTGRHKASIRWEFGDGGVAISDTPTHFYSLPGVYTAKLIVTSPGGCTDTATKTITVFGPNGTLTYTPSGGCSPLTLNFNVVSQNTSFITYDFGNGDGLFDTTNHSVSYTYQDSGLVLPRIILKDDKDCEVPIYGKDSVRILRVFPEFDAPVKTLCERGFISFTDKSSVSRGGTISTYLWNFGDGQTSTDKNPVHEYTSAGQYDVTLTVTSQFGCTETITKPAFVLINRAPVTAITASADSICVNGTITFNGIIVQPDTLALTWHWVFGNGQSSTLQNPPAQTFSVAGTYNVQLITTNTVGCRDTVIFPVYIQPLPQINAGADVDICVGQSIQLNASGANSYQWSPATGLSCTNCANPTANPTDTTRYVVTGVTAFGCSASDSVWVNVIQPSQVVAPPDDSICVGQSIQLLATGTTLYSWSPATGLSNPSIANPMANPATTTTYIVTGRDSKNCFTSTDEVTISVFPYPTVTTSRDTTIQVGFFTQLNSTVSPDVQHILWSPTVGLSCTTCPNPVASPTFNSTYTITVTNNGGCTASDAVNIFVVCNDLNLFMPNTFSPNGDGNNDIFYPRGRGINTIRSLRIFNRWGQLVFEKKNFNANDPSAGWDGTFKGSRSSPDVYVYMMDLSCENNSIITRKGDVTLIR